MWQRRKVGTTHPRRRNAFLPRSLRWGTWHTDSRGRAVHNAPFRIPAQALAQYSYQREAWLGFKTLFREFGGKPLETHPSRRHVGPRNVCLTVFGWQRQFADSLRRLAYRRIAEGKTRHYVLGHQEMEFPLDRQGRYFLDGVHEAPNSTINAYGCLIRQQCERSVGGQQIQDRFPLFSRLCRHPIGKSIGIIQLDIYDRMLVSSRETTTPPVGPGVVSQSLQCCC